MALQDQTLANTQAKMGLELARRRRARNTQATLASITAGGPRRPSDLPWWAQDRLDGGTPVVGLASSQAKLQGLGGLMLGVAGQKLSKKNQQAIDPIYGERETLGRIGDGVRPLTRRPTAASFSRRESLLPAGMSPAQLSSLRISPHDGVLTSVLNTLMDHPIAGQNGAPAGSGLPELGV